VRVLHVSEVLPGGISSYLGEILPPQVAFYGRDNVALLGPREQQEYVACRGDFQFFGYHRTGRDIPSLLRLAAALRRVLGEFRPDILHLHSSLAGAVGRVVARSSGFAGKVVYCAHGWAFDPNRGSRAAALLKLAETALYWSADAIVNISPHEAKFQPARWSRGSRVRLIQSGIADDAGAPLQAPVDPGGPRRWRLLFAGRTEYLKGFDLLLSEMAELRDEAELIVASDHPVGSDSLPNITFLGWLPRDQIKVELARADFVVMPSRSEGMPLVALEAMRAGRPVIASGRGPFPYIVEHNKTGLLIDIDQPGFLRRALDGVTPADALRMGAAAREAFANRFTSARMNQGLASLYRELYSPAPERLSVSLVAFQLAEARPSSPAGGG
jgi:glycosyltransferase involved in cell wall biosynthesis